MLWHTGGPTPGLLTSFACLSDPRPINLLCLFVRFLEPVQWDNGDTVYVDGRKAIFAKARGEWAVISWVEGGSVNGIDIEIVKMGSLSANRFQTGICLPRHIDSQLSISTLQSVMLARTLQRAMLARS